MAEYRITLPDPKNKTLQIYVPPHERNDRELALAQKRGDFDTMSKGAWTNIGYYRRWEHIMEELIDREIVILSEDVETQLRSLEGQIQDAIQTIIKELEIVKKYG
jgi:hypothetical protein